MVNADRYFQVNKSLFILFLLISSARAATTIDTLIDAEAGTDGAVATVSLATNCTHGVTGPWTTVPSGGLSQLFISTAKVGPFRGPVIAGGTTYDGTGATRSFRMHNTSAVNVQHMLKYSFSPTKGKVSVGFGIYLSSAGGGWGHTSDFFDIYGMNGANGDFITLNHQDAVTGPLIWRSETQSESGGSTETFNPVQDKWYWITALWDRPGLLGTIKIYDADTWLVVGHLDSVLHNEDCNYVSIGRYDAHGTSAIMNADYYIDNFMIDYTTALFPLLPPGAIVKAPTASRTDFNRAYTNTVSGSALVRDTISIPAGSNEWTSQFNIDKTIYIKGAGSNANQTVIQLNAGSQDSIFRCNQTFTEVSDIQFRGVNQANSGWLLRFPTNWCKAHDCHFTQALSATIMDGFSLVYNCSFLNCTRMGRAFGPGSGEYNWTNGYAPINFASTNFAVWEDNTFTIDSGMDATLNPQVVISSQQGSLWIARFCKLNIANFSYAPFFDSHGETDPGLRGNIGVQVYSNTVTMTGPSSLANWDKFVDIRGGAALVYSNTVTGFSSSSGVYMREKDGETADYTKDPVTNVWIFNNLMDGNPMPAVVEANDAAKIILHTHYEITKPVTLLSVAYPHPLRVAGGGGSPPPPPSGPHKATKIAGKPYARGRH